MNCTTGRITALLAASLTALACGPAAYGQAYPSRAITFVSPFGPGPAGDQLARTMGRLVADETKQPVVVENKAGANGIIGVDFVAKAAPDGYTVLITSSATQVLNPHLYKKLPYDALKDFVPLTSLGGGSLTMSVNGKSAFRSVADVVDFARRNPGKLSVGSHTAVTRMAGELLAQLTGVQMLNVNYKALPPGVVDLIGGQIDLLFPAVDIAAPHIKTGALRALAVTGKQRMAELLPDVPTIEESGVKGYDMTFWYGAYVPARTPPAVVNRLRDLLVSAAAKPDMAKFFSQNALAPLPYSGAEFATFQANELDKWGQVIRKAQIPPE